jgi:hypothetical protein
MAALVPLPTRAKDLPLVVATALVGGGNGVFVVGVGVCEEVICVVVG